MTKAKTTSGSELLGFTELFKGVDSSAIWHIQQRNMEALARANRLITDSAAAIFSKQVELMQPLKNVRVSGLAAELEGSDVPQALHHRFEDNWTALEKTVTQIRDINDRARECCYEVLEEIGSCMEENLRDMNAGIGRFGAKGGKEKAAETKPKAEAQTTEKLRSVAS